MDIAGRDAGSMERIRHFLQARQLQVPTIAQHGNKFIFEERDVRFNCHCNSPWLKISTVLSQRETGNQVAPDFLRHAVELQYCNAGSVAVKNYTVVANRIFAMRHRGFMAIGPPMNGR
ncbi:MAG: hypothetical protein IPJ50_03610 [Betaproteobacteria bacterium]|nr:hypothetical protein [Betaproteobacteria bacterium]